MARGGRGCRGVSSSAYSGSNGTKDAATLIGLYRLGKNLERIPIPITDSHECQFLFDLYEECVSTNAPLVGPNCCSGYQELMASCPEINKDPGRRNTLQRVKEWEEYFQRRAIREGFSGWEEYIARKDETDPTMCRLTYKLYKECLSENETYCHLYRNKCPEFEQAPKGHSAVDMGERNCEEYYFVKTASQSWGGVVGLHPCSPAGLGLAPNPIYRMQFGWLQPHFGAISMIGFIHVAVLQCL
ncbi:hypothetical protein Vadar_000514 [Vaccinium darrowii]|uniref:Uncharacterized protein n=1 Tax=Vaccinium darrowii TaxID=229202 RepID=A0ACB7XEH3_9ERIC|nr:hypothetical protein Vadar_000514 [Vaccinium darrowii]